MEKENRPHTIFFLVSEVFPPSSPIYILAVFSGIIHPFINAVIVGSINRPPPLMAQQIDRSVDRLTTRRSAGAVDPIHPPFQLSGRSERTTQRTPNPSTHPYSPSSRAQTAPLPRNRTKIKQKETNKEEENQKPIPPNQTHIKHTHARKQAPTPVHAFFVFSYVASFNHLAKISQ